MKRIGKYLITVVGLMSVGGAPSLLARDRDFGRDRREIRRYEVRHDYRHFDRDDYCRRRCRY